MVAAHQVGSRLPGRFNPALALFSQTASAPSSPATASVAIARPPEKTGLESALRVTWDDLDSAIRDLLALEIDPSKYLPGDDSTRGFDNIAGALAISLALLEVTTGALFSSSAYRRSLVMCTESFSFSLQMNSIS